VSFRAPRLEAAASRNRRLGRPRGGISGIGKLERLQKLGESGALTDAEFEREKAKILAE
jgi:hypothetical protein